MALFAKCWELLVCMCQVTFTTHFISAMFIGATSVQTACSIWAAISTSLLTTFETFDRIDSHWLGNSSVGLVAVKIFHVISCSLAYWSSVVYITSSCLFFDQTHFFTSKCLVAWNNNSFLHTSFLPLCTDISQLDSLYVDLAYLLTCCHLAWHCCTFHWYGSSRRSTLLAYLRWPEKLPLDPSLHWHPLIWAKCSII